MVTRLLIFMEYGELYIEPERKSYNPTNGQFLKGHVPHNKGKRWSDYMGKRKQKRASKGWTNIIEHRGPGNICLAEQSKTQVIAVGRNGDWLIFPSCTEAAKWCGSTASNVSRCCRWNQCGHKHTDYKCKGVRFYYEKENTWINKIQR